MSIMHAAAQHARHPPNERSDSLPPAKGCGSNFSCVCLSSLSTVVYDIRAYTHVCTHVYTCVYAREYTHVYICVYTCAHTHVHTHVCTCVNTHSCTCVYMCLCTWIYTWIYTCLYTCLYTSLCVSRDMSIHDHVSMHHGKWGSGSNESLCGVVASNSMIEWHSSHDNLLVIPAQYSYNNISVMELCNINKC